MDIQMQDLTYLSFENHFWIKWNSNCINFGWNKLHRDAHFTLAYNLNSPDINLHVTRNIKTVDDKPRQDLLVISKTLASDLAEIYANYFFGNMLVRLNMKQ